MMNDSAPSPEPVRAAPSAPGSAAPAARRVTPWRSRRRRRRPAPASGESTKVVFVAIAGNLAITVTKFIAAVLTGSSAMASEGIHSLVDTGNELLLLYGIRRATRPASAEHPLGHGRELYFWSFIVALMIFALGSGLTMLEGVMHVRTPEPMTHPLIAYAVLALSAVFEGTSWIVALRAFHAAKGDRGFLQALRDSKDPGTFTVLFEDTAALLGLAIAAAGVTASQVTGNPLWDGVASLGIGALLAVTAGLLLQETKALLVGEAALPEIQAAVLDIARSHPSVEAINELVTTHLAPEQILVALGVKFRPELRTADIEDAMLDIDSRLHECHPEVRSVFIKPTSDGCIESRG